MAGNRDPDDVIQCLIDWGVQRDAVRAMLLTSTRAIPGAAVDRYSDYDVVLVVDDIAPYLADHSWVRAFGEVLVAYWDPITPEPEFGVEQSGNVIQYADGLKIDFRLWPVVLLQRIVEAVALSPELDAGYRVLLDKDSLADRLRSPTYRAYIPIRPTEREYLKWVEEFFTDAPYVAKFLWRDELVPAKWCLDYDMKHIYLLRMLEWRVECEQGWSVPVRSLGKGLKRRLPAELWAGIEGTYAGAGIAENWVALYRTMALFRDVAIAVGTDLGYTYPRALDERVTAYVRSIQGQGREAAPHD